MSQVTVFSPDQTAVTFTDKKGSLHAITAEGAVWKGGAALASLKEVALDSALTKAMGGRYRAAADVLEAAFPKAAKAAAMVNGTDPAWKDKACMGVLLRAVANQSPREGKSFSVKQDKALDLLRALNRLPTFEVRTVETIEAAQ